MTNVTFSIAGEGIIFEVRPYNGEAKWSLTRNELYGMSLFVNVKESLAVKPSMSIHMSYPSGLTENVRTMFPPFGNYPQLNLNRSTGK